jgi:hypothetical protein
VIIEGTYSRSPFSQSTFAEPSARTAETWFLG